MAGDRRRGEIDRPPPPRVPPPESGPTGDGLVSKRRPKARKARKGSDRTRIDPIRADRAETDLCRTAWRGCSCVPLLLVGSRKRCGRSGRQRRPTVFARARSVLCSPCLKVEGVGVCSSGAPCPPAFGPPPPTVGLRLLQSLHLLHLHPNSVRSAR